MNLTNIINRVRSYTRDINGSIYRENDIIDFINEGIDRLRSIPELATMEYLSSKTDEVSLLPSQYHNLIAMYGASRCFFQDEQDYRAGSMMNEFESKMNELVGKIADGTIIIKDSDGNVIIPDYAEDSIQDVYFDSSYNDEENLDNYIKFYQ